MIKYFFKFDGIEDDDDVDLEEENSEKPTNKIKEIYKNIIETTTCASSTSTTLLSNSPPSLIKYSMNSVSVGLSQGFFRYNWSGKYSTRRCGRFDSEIGYQMLISSAALNP